MGHSARPNESAALGGGVGGTREFFRTCRYVLFGQVQGACGHRVSPNSKVIYVGCIDHPLFEASCLDLAAIVDRVLRVVRSGWDLQRSYFIKEIAVYIPASL